MIEILRFLCQKAWQDGWNQGVEFERLRRIKEEESEN